MSVLKSLIRSLKLHGIGGTAQTIVSKFISPRISNLEIYRSALSNNVGLEIGGPSQLFDDNGIVPVYSVLQRLDNCNFSNSTIWEGALKEGLTFRFHKDKPLGRQFISEAVALKSVASNAYDCVLSSNTIEHVANPLKALFEWKRVIKQHGHLLLVVPHRDGTFDHNRPVTPLPHILEDHQKNTTEDDLTHLEEILSLHDLEMDAPAGDKQTFKERSLKNFENRCLHHHVFDTKLVVKLVDTVGMQVLSVDPILPFFINVLARKPAPTDPTNNRPFIGPDAAYRTSSPFKSDRRTD